MSATKLDCKLMQIGSSLEGFVVVSVPYVSRERDGCLSSSLLLNMNLISNKIKESRLMWEPWLLIFYDL